MAQQESSVAGVQSGGGRVPELVDLYEVEARPVEWLWEPYLPLGMVSMLSGDPGCGSTYLAVAMAAAVTKGKVSEVSDVSEVSKGKVSEVSDVPDIPATAGKPKTVLYVSADSPEHVIRARFDLLGGRSNQLALLRSTISGEGDEMRRLPLDLSDLDVLEEAMRRTSPQLVIVDPVQSFVGGGTKPLCGAGNWLYGLSRLAEQYGCCILLVRHLSKPGTGRASARGLGAMDWTGAVQSELLAGMAEEDAQQRALVHVRSSVGALGPAWGYAITGDGQFQWAAGKPAVSAQALLAPSGRPDDLGATEEALDFLRKILAGGWRTATEVMIDAESLKIAPRTLTRAKFRLGVQSVRKDRTWYWRLPVQDTESGAESNT